MNEQESHSFFPLHPSQILFEAILTGHRSLANEIIDKWGKEHGYPSAVKDLLEPTLELIGKKWEAEQISLAIGYLAGKIAEDTLGKALELQQAIPLLKGPVVIGNIEDDFHALGRKMVGIFLQTAGWKVIDLGNDVMAEQFVNTALENKTRIIGISAMMFTTAQNILSVRKEITKRGLGGQIKLAVGGAVFKIRPELVKEVGGDGTATNAVDAPSLFDRLWKEAEKS